MTIALGVIASDGIVMAADTQETIPGYWKHSHGKIWECGRNLLETPKGGGAFCLIAGAGNAAQVDYISRALIHRFCAEPYLTEATDVQPALARELETFHARYLSPFAGYPRDDRPLVQLIVGHQYTNRVGELLVSEDNLLQPKDYTRPSALEHRLRKRCWGDGLISPCLTYGRRPNSRRT
jgi:hypothetical protein